MDVVKYIQERERMCKVFGLEECVKCPLQNSDCTNLEVKNPKIYVEVVEEWSNNNPVEKEIPFISFSNSEIEDFDTLGEDITCERCNEIHKVESGQIKRVDGTYEDSNMLQFVKCNGEAYLVGIKGKRWK
jgi:succinate dehydrogenase/fumarate reductase-like Fe-S protein